tara:strand:+ start:1786 stop:3192 length:1407 start_codon:yes stop_codon:yes gene_type:complete
MALTQISTKGIKDGTITGSDLATNVDLVDNQKLRLGNGQDLEIYHIADTANVITGSGPLTIQSDDTTSGVSIQTFTGGETMARFIKNGAVELYHDNSKRLETTIGGVNVTGELNVTTKVAYPDNAKAIFGTGDDLQISHNGSVNIINCATNATLKLQRGGSDVWELKSTGLQGIDNQKLLLGTSDDLAIYHNGTESIIEDSSDLYILGDPIQLRRPNGDKYVQCIASNAVKLFFDGNEKFATHSAGVLVSGNVYLNDNNKFIAGTSNDLSIYHDGNHSYIQDSGTGDLTLIASKTVIGNSGNNEVCATFTENDSVELYFNNNLRFETNTSATTMRGGGDHRCEGNFRPYNHNTYDLGTSGDKWDDIFATNGTIQTSDRNAKKDIATSDLGLTFINAVQPVSYKFKTGIRTHYGVIAQDLETVLDGKDFAGLTKDTETGNYGIRYTELIAPLIKAVQELSAEVAALKAS